MRTLVALLGAGGNMGTRLSNTLKDHADYELLCVEQDPARHDGIRQRGLQPVPAADAVCRADIVIFALADRIIGKVAPDIVPQLKVGAMVVLLDPAAPWAGMLPDRKDISYFVTHPAHPPVFNDETNLEARRDFFGSGKAKQAIVSALMQGPESDYAKGEKLACVIFGPVLRSHRVTVEQMAILEPALSETLSATCIKIIRDGLDEAVRRGVPREAARDFLLGHINVELAILFNEIDWDFSAGAKQAIAEAEPVLFRPDWKKIFDPDEVRKSVERIVGKR
jgi:D-apionate oxidoisomerase